LKRESEIFNENERILREKIEEQKAKNIAEKTYLK